MAHTPGPGHPWRRSIKEAPRRAGGGVGKRNVTLRPGTFYAETCRPCDCTLPVERWCGWRDCFYAPGRPGSRKFIVVHFAMLTTSGQPAIVVGWRAGRRVTVYPTGKESCQHGRIIASARREVRKGGVTIGRSNSVPTDEGRVRFVAPLHLRVRKGGGSHVPVPVWFNRPGRFYR